MRTAIRKIYTWIKKIPLLGPIASKCARVIKARPPIDRRPVDSDTSGLAMRQTIADITVDTLNCLSDRITVLEQNQQSIKNYLAVLDDTTTNIHQTQMKTEAEVAELSEKIAQVK